MSGVLRVTCAGTLEAAYSKASGILSLESGLFEVSRFRTQRLGLWIKSLELCSLRLLDYPWKGLGNGLGFTKFTRLQRL